jgi:outer membrane murein-binding lipoprotein Lpp
LQPDSAGRGGLEVLCHAHHAEITAAQATARATARANARLEAQATTETTI